MTEVLKPSDSSQLEDIVKWAIADEIPLEIAGLATKRGLGRPILGKHGNKGNLVIGHTVDLSSLKGVSLYEPDELVLTAGAGTPVSDIEELLESEGQQLAFEPIHMAKLYGHEGGTHGGLIACNLTGSRRIKAGSARDHVLGIKGGSGRGEYIKSGGRVVKNVTGYDLSKLMTASYGTLAALTEITVKVLPAPESMTTILIFGLDEKTAQRALSSAINSSHEVSGAAHLPVRPAARLSLSDIRNEDSSVTAMRIEGFRPSVVARCESLKKLLNNFGVIEEVDKENSVVFWRDVCDVNPYNEMKEPLWRLSITPSMAPTIVEKINKVIAGCAFYDWGGGLVWYKLDEYLNDAGATIIRDVINTNGGGHATLVRADDNIRSQTDVFHPQTLALAKLTSRVKNSFDPQRILNPGRMYMEV